MWCNKDRDNRTDPENTNQRTWTLKFIPTEVCGTD